MTEVSVPASRRPWTPASYYPDPAIRILHPSFQRYVIALGAVAIELLRESGRTQGDVGLAVLFYGGLSGGLLLAGLATDRDPAEIPAEIGDGGGGGLKRFVTDAINSYFEPIRARRSELAADPGHLLQVLREGNARANAIADQTLSEVRQAMGMTY